MKAIDENKRLRKRFNRLMQSLKKGDMTIDRWIKLYGDLDAYVKLTCRLNILEERKEKMVSLLKEKWKLDF